MSHVGRFILTQPPIQKHTFQSDVNVTRLPPAVLAVRRVTGGLDRVLVAVKDAGGKLLPEVVPLVSISKDGNYCDMALDGEEDPGLSASIEHKLSVGQLAGFVVEVLVPQGASPSPAHEALPLRAVFSGLPVARAGHNAPHCFVDPHPYFIAASNLTGAKARLLLMACLL